MYKNLLEGFDRAYGIKEDTVKTRDGKWANVGKDGKADSGKFKTKKEADAQRKAMFAKGFKESISREDVFNKMYDLLDEDAISAKDLAISLMQWLSSDELLEFAVQYGYDEYFDEEDLDESKCNKRHIIKSKSKAIQESLGNDLAKYQKWVDYDMKRYGRISDNTQNYLKRAGLEVVKDNYGDYEIIAKERDGITEEKEGTYYYIGNELSEKDAFYRSLRAAGVNYIDSDKLRDGITIDNVKYQIRKTPLKSYNEDTDLSNINGTSTKALQDNIKKINSATTPGEVYDKTVQVLEMSGINTNSPSISRMLDRLQRAKTLEAAFSIVYNSLLKGSNLGVR